LLFEQLDLCPVEWLLTAAVAGHKLYMLGVAGALYRTEAIAAMDNMRDSYADKPDDTGHSPDPPRIIVVVDDDRAIAELTVEVLNEEPGYHAVAVGDGRSALELIRSIDASLILTDVKLPGLDGFQLFDALRADPSTAGIPVIFMPATRFEKEFVKRGIERPLMKPFDIAELLARVAEVLPPRGAIDTHDAPTYN